MQVMNLLLFELFLFTSSRVTITYVRAQTFVDQIISQTQFKGTDHVSVIQSHNFGKMLTLTKSSQLLQWS